MIFLPRAGVVYRTEADSTDDGDSKAYPAGQWLGVYGVGATYGRMTSAFRQTSRLGQPL